MQTVKLLKNVGECDREHIGNIEHNFFVTQTLVVNII
jgi:hypothetical protein